ncbi:hypothetical protein [Paraburkholderia bryophila]|uniref:Uncharacterized protein n=1 Tax=Paraburkholderia bryophila TaxID=420952 RepID=A0A329C3L2_9BURK|nr:hypothetical protein [Paraburkholderia bryophila]RAS28850.1 hypothetical protein BX591_111130 [Paraburkholderia bryophila]
MEKIEYIHDHVTFRLLWQRSNECVEKLKDIPDSELLHFDFSNLGMKIFHDLIRELANFNGDGEFAVVVLEPDPFSYFHFHFGKYSGLIVKAHHGEHEFFDALCTNPGDSPADAIGYYSEKYVALLLSGDWFMYADRGWDGAQGC